MNKIDKFLKKLKVEDRKLILEILLQIQSGDTNNLDIKKLKGTSVIYRVRVGRIRIIFSKTKEVIMINNLEFRNDNTYN